MIVRAKITNTALSLFDVVPLCAGSCFMRVTATFSPGYIRRRAGVVVVGLWLRK